MKQLTVMLARPLEFLLGVIFIVAAVLKALDPNLFAAQIYGYRVVQQPDMLALAALFTLGAETFLGVAMVLGLRLRMLVLTLVQLMLAFFIGVILYAWLVHDLKDCGCFGRVPMTPPQAIAKNVVMMIAAVIAWRGIRLRHLVSPGGALWRTLVSAVVAIALVLYAAPALYQDAPQAPAAPPATGPEAPEAPEAPPVAAAPAAARPFAQYQVQTDTGETLDLGRGEYLVAILSTTCEHCMSMVPHLNDLSFYPELPPVVGLAYVPEEGSLEMFVAQTMPLFPLHSLGNNFIKFSEFIGNAPPRLTLVRDGAVVKHWDPVGEATEFASPEEIVQATQEGRAAAP
jgi:hypothetical protein